MQRDIEREERLERGDDPWADEAPAPDDGMNTNTGGTKP
jgi:hypothetical protein